MMAMTGKREAAHAGRSISQAESDDGDDSHDEWRGRTRVPSGLSALIQAATSQLSQLAECASAIDVREETIQKTTRYSGNDHDEVEMPASANCTPPMVPEPDPSKQSFPELLMTLALDPANVDVITFLPDGKFFAIRCKEFAEDIMLHYFTVTTFEEFIDLCTDWGFSRILNDATRTHEIEVFRHPQFIKGEWSNCARIRFGESPTDARLSALPDRARVEFTLSDDSGSLANNTKRRLSPGFLARRESESSVSSQKLKIEVYADHELMASPELRRRNSQTESEAGDSLPAASYTNASRSDDLRSLALSITTEKLQIKQDMSDDDHDTKSTALVERAVESATHTIVTEAIETLLRDEVHTKETYKKHEEELSRSSLPGVVPISKLLFSDTKENTVEQLPPREISTGSSSDRISDARHDPASRSSITPAADDKLPSLDAATSELIA